MWSDARAADRRVFRKRDGSFGKRQSGTGDSLIAMNLKLETSKTDLVRGLTLIAAMSVVVGNVIGTGVFLTARVMTCNVGTPGKVLALYVVAGLLSLAGALSYAELAAMMPSAGGEYVFMREAYGRPWGFLFGWMSFFIGKARSHA